MTKEEIQKLTTKLNIEYKGIGSIHINSAEKREVRVANIKYKRSTMSSVKPLPSYEPIVVAKKYKFGDEYIIIDGYHRFKHLEASSETINVICLLSYNIERSPDDLLSFFKGAIGSDICFLSDELVKINGTLIEIETNEGCGGCSNGWSEFSIVDGIKDTHIVLESVDVKNEDDDKYDLFFNGIHVAEVDTGWGNGYYGGDFTLKIIT